MRPVGKGKMSRSVPGRRVGGRAEGWGPVGKKRLPAEVQGGVSRKP